MASSRSEKGHRRQRRLSAPIMVNLELTSACNIKCRYCYNFWRDTSDEKFDRISRSQMKRLVELFKKANVFHAVLTGGEPFLNFDVLVYALEALREADITTSVNSNLTLADAGKMKRLRAAGMDHVLTSLNSYDPEISNYLSSREGTHARIIQGIRLAIESGIRVSVNMIISEQNRAHVYETVRLCAQLGVQRVFGTRLVPSVNVLDPGTSEFHLGKTAAISVLDDLIRARDDFNIAVGSLIGYPLCLLGDLEKYADFIGRGCPAQRGNRMVINADGSTHACTHESRSYGNVFDIGIAAAFQKMYHWHDDSYLYPACQGCPYLRICRSGCRSAAYSYSGRMDGKDPLSGDFSAIKKSFRLPVSDEVIQALDGNQLFDVSGHLRFRKENGFYVVNIRWANAINVEKKIAEFLIDKKASRQAYTLAEFLAVGTREDLLHLIYKEAVLPADQHLREKFKTVVKAGCSIDPEDLPEQRVL